MPLNIEKDIENIFRTATSSDEIFDALILALNKRIKNLELYKILLANNSLSKEELIMFTEKICGEFSDFSYELYNWLAKILENNLFDIRSLESALYYYQKAFLIKPAQHAPLLSAFCLYNYELNLPVNFSILQFVSNGISSVEKKSEVYQKLSEHFMKTNNLELSKKYAGLAEQSRRKENQ